MFAVYSATLDQVLQIIQTNQQKLTMLEEDGNYDLQVNMYDFV